MTTLKLTKKQLERTYNKIGINELSKMANVTKQAMYYHLNKHGIPRNRERQNARVLITG